MSERLKEKVAIVTGGSRGIGRATSLILAQEGAAVVVNYRRETDAANDVVESIRGRKGRAIAVQGDVADKSQVEGMVQRALDEFGQIDILVNNAAIAYLATLLDSKEEDLDKMLAVNLKGVDRAEILYQVM